MFINCANKFSEEQKDANFRLQRPKRIPGVRTISLRISGGRSRSQVENGTHAEIGTGRAENKDHDLLDKCRCRKLCLVREKSTSAICLSRNCYPDKQSIQHLIINGYNFTEIALQTAGPGL